MQGCDIKVLGYSFGAKKSSTEILNGVEVTRLAKPLRNLPRIKFGRFFISLSPIWDRLFLSRGLNRMIMGFKPDLIESYDWSGPLFFKPKGKLLVRLHGANSAYQFFEKKRLSRQLAFFEKRNIEFADHLVSVSKHIGEVTMEALSMNGNQFQVIPNSYDEKLFRPDPTVTKDFNELLFVGRVHPRKGIFEIMRILRLLLQDRPDLRLKMVGEVSEKIKTQLLEILGNENHRNVSFTGKVPHDMLPKHYQTAGLVLIPSRAEAFGLTAIEAMACGAPLVMTKLGSGPELVSEGENGWLMDIHNPEGSADKICTLLDHPGNLQSVGEKAAEYAKSKYSSERVVSFNKNYFKEIVDNA